MSRQDQGVRLVFAPSNSGKSWLSRRYPERYLDGDTIIRDTIGWPPGEWWRDPATKAATHRANFEAMRQYLAEHSGDLAGKTVLFFDDVETFAPLIDAVWIPPLEVVVRNWTLRSAHEPDRPQPGLRETIDSWSKAFNTARDLGIPVTHDIEPESTDAE